MHYEWNTFASNWNHGGISCDVHFAGHLRSNRTNVWSDKSNIRNVQSGGARGLELRTAALVTVQVNLTGSCYEHVRAAAGEAVQEWSGSDIEVQECCGTAELSQAEPGPHETGLVPQEKRDRVPFFEPSLRAQRIRYFITLLIHLLIRVSLALEMNKHFSRVLLHRLQKTVHYTIERSFPFVYV